MSRFTLPESGCVHVARDRQRRSALLFALLVTVLMLVPLAGFGQQLTGSLSGTVTDQSGAAVPNADVAMKNEASGDIRKTVSNGGGYFTITAVPPGTYTVTVSSAGLRTWQETGVVFNQGDSRTLPNINLQVGGTTQTVEVITGADAIVPVDTGEVSTTLNNHMVTELSLQGRDAGELLKIMPGMAMTNGLSNSSTFSDRVVGTNSGPVGAFSANGTQPNGAMSYMLDGANLIDPGNAGTQIANINQDMTAEVKVLMSSYGAEYAKGPVVFQAYSKSGGSAFHGEGYLYARNGVFNSLDSFQKNQGLTKPDEFYYYPGGNIGGPVLIPGTRFNHSRTKLFFWFGYEYMRQQPAGSLREYFVPTDQMLAGNFSPSYLASLGTQVSGRYGNITSVPTCGTACGNLTFPNGMIPSTLFDPNAVALLKLYPKPNIDPATHGGNNYEFLDSSPQNRWEQSEKIDYSVSDNTKITFSYTRQDESDLHPIQVWWSPPSALPYPSPMAAATTANVYMANATHVFSPTLTNETVFTYAKFINPVTLANPAAVDPTKVGYNVKGLFGQNSPTIPNILSWSGNGGLAGFYPQASFGGAFNGGAFGALKSDPAFYDNLSKVAGSHTLKFGFYWDQNRNQQSSSNFTQGTLDFETYGATTTGNLYADMLLGHAQSYSQANAIPVDDVKYHQISFFGQDSWKATRRLTLNYGLRFDHVGQWYDDKPGLFVFDLSKYDNSSSAPANTGLLVHSTDSSIPLSGFKSPTFYYNPRLGVAFDVFGNGKTVIRGGFAVFRYQFAVNSIGPATDSALGAFTYGSPSLTSLAQIDSLTVPTGSSLNGGTIYPLAMGDGKVPRTTDYNFTLSQAVPWHSVVEVSYVGNRSADLLTKGSNSKINDLNAIPAGSFFKPDPITGVTPCVVGTCTGLNTNDYFPLRNYQDIYVVGHGSYANYNSLQAAWQKQAGHATFLLNYTFSKVLGIRDGESDNGFSAGSLLDPFNIRNNYGVLGYDHTHVFNAAYVINLPSPVHGNAILKGAVNGWEVSGITQLQSGSPLQPNTGGTLNVAFPGTVSNNTYLGTNAISLAPKVVCDPRSGLASGQYFNPSCFAPPAPGSNGDLIFPYIKGPPFFNSDLSLFKNFKISESKRIQFRVQAFNFLNHPNKEFAANGNGDISLNFNGANGVSQTNTNAATNGYPGYSVGNRLVEFAFKFYF